MKRAVLLSVTGIAATLLTLVSQAHQNQAEALTPSNIRYEARTWGANDRGQLGDGTTIDRNSPAIIPNFAEQYALGGSLDAGGAHSLFSTFQGQLWSWGANDRGQLGDGTTIERVSPVRIVSNTYWESVSAAGNHSLAIGGTYQYGVPRYGELWAWGANDQGQLGDGTTSDRLSPVQVGASDDWQAISGGGSHSLAVKSDGTLWAWGLNSSGQLGDGTTTNRLSPVQIGASVDWKAISAGGSHSFGLKSDGTLWAWGANDQGQLGDGTTTNRLSPEQIGDAGDWKAISAGGSHSLAVASDGTLWAWGLNSSGQVGDGTTTNRLSPVQIGVSEAWASVSAGGSHSFGTTVHGLSFAWGLNADGQLGDGSMINRSSPVRIERYSPVAGENHSIGMRIVPQTTWATPDPTGSVDNAMRVMGGVRVSGWAIDPETTDPIDTHVYIDGIFAGVLDASLGRPDLLTTLFEYGSPHGFSGVLPAGSSAQTACVYGINRAAGTNSLIGCKAIHSDPIGSFDMTAPALGGSRVAGWALDPETNDSIDVHYYLDGQIVFANTANAPRPDVAAAHLDYGPAHGFDTTVAMGPGFHTVCAYGINKAAGDNALIGCRWVMVDSDPFGKLDVLEWSDQGTRVAGWVIDGDTAEPTSVHVYVNGIFTKSLDASLERADLADVFRGYGGAHGFDVAIQANIGDQVCLYGINKGPGTNTLIGCGSV